MKRILLLVSITASALSAQTYRVPLEVRAGEKQFAFISMDLVSDDATHRHAAIPGGGELRIERMPPPMTGIIVQIPGGEPSVMALLPGQESAVELNRKVGNATSVPYIIGYDRDESAGVVRDFLRWIPSYRAEGKLMLPGCEVNLAVLDFNGDGLFDNKDSRQATTLLLDLNNDRRFWGAAEHRRMDEIIEICGSPLEVAELDPHGLFITFRVSDLKVPVIGRPVPQFSVPTTTGQLLRSSELHGRIYVLDFWASWCVPCVAELDALNQMAREHADTVGFYGIDVDEPERREVADGILQKKALSFPQVIREHGEKDFLWKLFGSMEGARLTVPLFVVVDQEGMIRYASSGGENLAELKKTLQELLNKPNHGAQK